MLDGLLPDRPLDEQLAGYITVSLGGRQYELPTLNRRANRAWKALLNERMGVLFAGIGSSDNPAAIMAALALADDAVVEVVRAYDEQGIIPDDDDPALAADTDQEWLRAMLACAAAAYPFVGLAASVQRQQPTIAPPPEEPPAAAPTPMKPTGRGPTNSPRRSGAGARATSKAS